MLYHGKNVEGEIAVFYEVLDGEHRIGCFIERDHAYYAANCEKGNFVKYVVVVLDTGEVLTVQKPDYRNIDVPAAYSEAFNNDQLLKNQPPNLRDHFFKLLRRD